MSTGATNKSANRSMTKEQGKGHSSWAWRTTRPCVFFFCVILFSSVAHVGRVLSHTLPPFFKKFVETIGCIASWQQLSLTNPLSRFEKQVEGILFKLAVDISTGHILLQIWSKRYPEYGSHPYMIIPRICARFLDSILTHAVYIINQSSDKMFAFTRI